MTALELSVVVLTATWLLLLTVVVLVMVRQLAIVTVRLNRTGPAIDLARDGLMIGSKIPPEVATAIPELADGVVYVLMTSATCAPCRQVAGDLGQTSIGETLVALIAGPENAARELAGLFPSSVRPILDPVATALAKVLDLHSTPYALEMEHGEITGKAFLHGGADLMRLVDAHRRGGRRISKESMPERGVQRTEVTASGAK